MSFCSKNKCQQSAKVFEQKFMIDQNQSCYLGFMIGAKFCRNFFGVSKFNAQKDYYKTLNLVKTAEKAQIKKAFRQLAKKYHPDSNKGKQQMFKQVNEAYQVLSDQQTRREYDQVRMGSSQSNFSGFQSNNKGYTNDHQKSTYRGYQKQQGWSNTNYRDQIMYQIFKAQQQQRLQRERSNNSSFSQMYQKQNPNVRPFGKPIDMQRIRDEQIKKAYQEQIRRRERQFQNFKNQQQIAEKMKKKAQQMANGLIDNVKGFEKISTFLKDAWKDFSKKK